MSAHSTHDWNPDGYCFACTAFIAWPSAQLECQPTTDDAPQEPEAVVVNWFAITRGVAG